MPGCRLGPLYPVDVVGVFAGGASESRSFTFFEDFSIPYPWSFYLQAIAARIHINFEVYVLF